MNSIVPVFFKNEEFILLHPSFGHLLFLQSPRIPLPGYQKFYLCHPHWCGDGQAHPTFDPSGGLIQIKNEAS